MPQINTTPPQINTTPPNKIKASKQASELDKAAYKQIQTTTVPHQRTDTKNHNTARKATPIEALNIKEYNIQTEVYHTTNNKDITYKESEKNSSFFKKCVSFFKEAFIFQDNYKSEAPSMIGLACRNPLAKSFGAAYELGIGVCCLASSPFVAPINGSLGKNLAKNGLGLISAGIYDTITLPVSVLNFLSFNQIQRGLKKLF